MGAMIMPGIKIADGAVIGAGSIVTKDIVSYAIVAGNPARFIRSRIAPELIKLLRDIRWWDWPDEKIKLFIEDISGPVGAFVDKHRLPSRH